MHPKNRLLLSMLLGLLLGLLAGEPVLSQEAAPQPKEQPPRPGTGPLGAMIVPSGSTRPLQMSKKQRIVDALNPNPIVARVAPSATDPNGTTVLVTGLEPGVTQITLVDADGKREVYDIIVQFDVEYLRTLIQRAVPTSNITPIPSANNTVILTGTVASAEDVDPILRTAATVVGGIERVVNSVRVGGVQQVQLDVVIARVSRTELRRMAFDFVENGNQHLFASTVGGALIVPQNTIGTFPAPGSPGFVNLPTQVLSPNGVPSNLFLGIFSPTQDFFGLLQALRDDDLVKILAKPVLVTMSGRPASFIDGGEQAVPVPAGLGQIGIQFEEFGTRLNFLPVVLGNGKIHLEVEPEVSELNAAFGTSIQGTNVPGRTTQRIHTTVELRDGETFVLGGLIEHDVTAISSRVPVLGELPIIGAAFSRKSYNEVETELLVVVTPHLVDAMACDQAPKIVPGEETRSPDDFELFLEGILEAPRGPREVCPNYHYVPAFKNGPTASVFPCAGGRHDGGLGCQSGDAGCASCSGSGTLPVATVPAKPAGPQDVVAPAAPNGSGSGSLPVANLPAKPAAPEEVAPPAAPNGPAAPASGTLPAPSPAPSSENKPTPPPEPVANSGGTEGK
jgi:pilus assembly protein CpaC